MTRNGMASGLAVQSGGNYLFLARGGEKYHRRVE